MKILQTDWPLRSKVECVTQLAELPNYLFNRQRNLRTIPLKKRFQHVLLAITLEKSHSRPAIVVNTNRW